MKLQIFLFSLFTTEGLIITFVNLAIVLTILRHGRLHREKSYIILAGLAFGDLMNGFGLATAGPHRLWLTINNRLSENVTNWDCMMRPYTWLWVYSMPLASVMLTCVSVDRLLAVITPYRYFNWGTAYAYTLVGIFFSFSFVLSTIGVGVAYHQPIIKQYGAVCFTDYALVDSTYRFIFWNTITMGGVLSVVIYVPACLLYIKHKKNKVTNIGNRAQRHNEIKQKRLLVTLAISSLFTFIFFVFPSMTILAFARTVPAEMYAVIAPIAGVLKNVNPILNFFIYIKRHKDIKIGFICMIKCKDMPVGKL